MSKVQRFEDLTIFQMARDLHKETDKSKQQSKMQHFGEVLTESSEAVSK
jgi:hypothetical protein